MKPFPFQDPAAYERWRAQKLRWASDDSLLTPTPLSAEPTVGELQALGERTSKRGFAIYQTHPDSGVDKSWLIRLGQQFGLERLDSNLCADPDSITTLKVKTSDRPARYIPYSNRSINWHTDGYYNPADQQINALILHCESPAAEGGENGLFDIDLAYIALRDENPDFVAALAHPRAMSIPPNEEAGSRIRDWETGPVFRINPETGRLHMRYTARTRNIVWRDDPTTLEAVAFLQNLLTSGDNGVIRYRLSAGEGVICNNALHCRTGFEDSADQKRLFYRARYFDSLDFSRSRSPRLN